MTRANRRLVAVANGQLGSITRAQANGCGLTDNPDSYMILMDNDENGLPDASTEIRVPLHKGARFVVDTQRLWHVVVHNGDEPRYALITSFESGPSLDSWIATNTPVA